MVREPELGNHPVEYFGYPFVDHSKEAEEARAGQYCPFLKEECKKPRKSQPDIKVGVCTVGYKGSFLDHVEPVIICPHRFSSGNVFKAIEDSYFGALEKDYEIRWATEVSMGVGGSVDFVAAKMKKFGGLLSLSDFVCLEFQAAGTTGTPWEAVKEFRETGSFGESKYGFGINWANEFVKTMMQQVYKKGRIIEYWGKKIIFAFQDVGLAYLNAYCDTSGLKRVSKTSSILFYIFRMTWDETRSLWLLRLDRTLGTNTQGIRKLLGGALKEKFPTLEDFVENVKRKLIA